MSVWTGRSQPSLDFGVAARSAAPRRAVPSGRVFAALALACLALGVLVDWGAGGASRPVAPVAGSHVASRTGLLSLPLAAQGPVSAALGRDAAAYRVEGLVARNPAQRFSARFGPSGVAITAAGPFVFLGRRFGVRP